MREFKEVEVGVKGLSKRRLVYGVGVNDASYNVRYFDGDESFLCPYYQKWVDMLKRCYSKRFLLKNSSYSGCKVCDDWLVFSSFKRWMMSQQWEGKSLDKDILVKGNKEYSPETCLFIPQQVNCFVLDNKKIRGKYKIGVSFNKQMKKFRAQIKIKGKQTHLGYFDDEESAHKAYLDAKKDLVSMMCAEEPDTVRLAILNYISNQ